jgi:hypothetical protein
MAAHRSTHFLAVLCILRYLKGTLFHGLYFSSQTIKISDRALHIGYVYMLPVLLAYINRHLMYIIFCDSIYNIAFNT